MNYKEYLKDQLITEATQKEEAERKQFKRSGSNGLYKDKKGNIYKWNFKTKTFYLIKTDSQIKELKKSEEEKRIKLAKAEKEEKKPYYPFGKEAHTYRDR